MDTEKTYKPLIDNVIVRPAKRGATKTAAGVIVPATATTRIASGEVIAVGPGKPMGVCKSCGGRKFLEVGVSVGQIVHYFNQPLGKISETEVVINQGHILWMEEKSPSMSKKA